MATKKQPKPKSKDQASPPTPVTEGDTAKPAANDSADGATVQADQPVLFRINIEVADLARAVAFYTTLLGIQGRLDRGARCYFRCGPVTLQVVDVSADGSPHTAAKALYFVVEDLDAVFVRARSLGCLSPDDIHGEPGSSIVLRPWGERSFYAEDPWGNPLCFVETGTIYLG